MKTWKASLCATLRFSVCHCAGKASKTTWEREEISQDGFHGECFPKLRNKGLGSVPRPEKKPAEQRELQESPHRRWWRRTVLLIHWGEEKGNVAERTGWDESQGELLTQDHQPGTKLPQGHTQEWCQAAPSVRKSGPSTETKVYFALIRDMRVISQTYFWWPTSENLCQCKKGEKHKSIILNL